MNPHAYIFRVAISNNRILDLRDDRVTIRYKDPDTGKARHYIVTAEQFIRRFLQHVLPKGSVKVRYYGFFSHGKCHLCNQIRRSLRGKNTSLSGKFLLSLGLWYHKFESD